jgi:hypothetical protein
MLKTKSLIGKNNLFFPLLLIMFFQAFLMPPRSVQANEIVEFKPQVSVPNSAFSANVPIPVGSGDIGEYIDALYRYGITAIGILAVVIIMVGGITLITSGGSRERVQSAKGWIGASVTGLILALASFSILYFINPDLVKKTPLHVPDIEALALPKNYFGKNSSSICRWSESTVCPDRWLEKDKSYCKDAVQPEQSVCCCPAYGGDWDYDPGIKNQLGDASPKLIELMDCLRDSLPEKVGRISSISDSYGLKECRENYNSANCAHSKNSCHYGGGIHQLSHAIDIGDEENARLIKEAYNKCTHLAGSYLDEGTHIHISTIDCRRN